MVSIIIVTKGRKDYLKACLDSIEGQTYLALEIIVIDNSCDASFREGIIKSYPRVKLYSNRDNLFYCPALNKGIQMSNGDFILCLNDDVILDKKFIEEALRGFCHDAKIGMVSGKILRREGKTIDSTGLFLSFWRTAKERGYGSSDKGQFQKEGYVFGVNGAAAFYSKNMLESIKENECYFDADFRIFYEDLDIAWRAQRLGWKGYYVPAAIAYHVRGGTVRAGSGIDKPYARRFLNNELEADLIKNRYLAIIKNESAFNFLLHLPGMVLYDFIIWSYILSFRPRLVKTFFSKIKYLKSALEKRKLKLSIK